MVTHCCQSQKEIVKIKKKRLKNILKRFKKIKNEINFFI